jgi:glycosyltransferase involved in cell wall biosynthesis
MRIAYVSPLPPVRSGIAQYSALLLPALAERYDVVAVVDQESIEAQAVPVIGAAEYERRAGEFDAIVCQLGNNRYHEYAWKVANRGGAVIVLHDVVMHHLLVELTIAQGDANGLDDALASMYGEAGSAIAAAREHGIHDDLPNFLYPASEGVAKISRHVIVHNRWAAERLRSNGVTTPITVGPLAYAEVPPLGEGERERTRRELGFSPEQRVVGVFGFVTHAKRPGVVMRAFAEARRENDDLRLLFVGEPSHNVDLAALAAECDVPAGSWAKTGFVSDEEFDRYIAAVDRVANLRYPSAGEASGPLVHAFAIGRPIAVSDYAQFADFPSSMVTRIPFDAEVESLARFMTADLDEGSIGRAQREWLRETSTLGHAVGAYVTAIESREPGPASAGSAPASALALFPRLSASIESVARAGAGIVLSVRIVNEGDAPIPAALYGQPPFVIFAKARAAGVPSETAAVSLPGDLEPGGTAIVSIALDRDMPRFTLELRHGLGGIPDLERPPFFAGEVGP